MPLAAKLKPTFFEDIFIPVPGEPEPTKIRGEFKALSLSELKQWMDESKGKSDKERIPLVLVGWVDVELPFSQANLDHYVETYVGFGKSVVETFIDSIQGVRKGNSSGRQ